MTTEKKIHVGLLFGGNSSEHDVSKRSAHNIYDAMDKDKYEVSLFLLTKQGIMLGDAASKRIFDGVPEDQVVAEEMPKLDLSDPLAPIKNLSEVRDIDIFYPVVHGNLGEDGTLQGLFKLLKKPYIGSGVLGSAASFDKDITKQILTHNGVQNTKYVVVTPLNQDEWTWDKVVATVGSPIFMKPANQGSSVGIHKASNAEEYTEGLKDAFRYDFKILVEESIENPREVECSVLGNEHPKASKLGAIDVPKTDVFYDYNNKFVDASAVNFELPVELPADLTKRIQDMSLKAFEVLGLKGLARIDFLVGTDGEPYLGEVNTLPGFTNISLYPKLWEIDGISYTDLIDELIQLAFDEFERQSKLHFDFVALDAE